MLERQVLIPTGPQRLWEALTDPERVSTWLGAKVEWDLIPGGRARFTTDDGDLRHGQVEEVEPARHLRFRWWPEGEHADATSEVTYDLEPEDEGTRLTVTERPVPNGSVAISATGFTGKASASWTGWDTRLVSIWGRMTATDALGAH